MPRCVEFSWTGISEYRIHHRNLKAAARTLGLQLVLVDARTDSDLEPAFAAFPLVQSWSSTVPSTTGAWNAWRR